MKKIGCAFLLLCISSSSFAKLQIATTTTDLAAIVRKVGADHVEVFSIAKGTQDPHQIEAKPSFMIKLKNSDLMIAHGLELESAWMQPLIRGSRNSKLATSGGVLELAASLDPLEKPQGSLSRSEGDVHPGGNPHFQLDPVRVSDAAVLIAEKLSALDSSHKEMFTKNAQDFKAHLLQRNTEWQARLKKAGVTEVVTYHKYFTYFCERYGIQCKLQLEPKPGIPPTASHLLTVIEQMKARKINLVMIENLYEDSVGEKLKQAIPSVRVQRVPVSVEGEPGIKTNEDLIERVVKVIEGKN